MCDFNEVVQEIGCWRFIGIYHVDDITVKTDAPSGSLLSYSYHEQHESMELLLQNFDSYMGYLRKNANMHLIGALSRW